MGASRSLEAVCERLNNRFPSHSRNRPVPSWRVYLAKDVLELRDDLLWCYEEEEAKLVYFGDVHHCYGKYIRPAVAVAKDHCLHLRRELLCSQQPLACLLGRAHVTR
jgi:hypothetical protein